MEATQSAIFRRSCRSGWRRPSPLWGAWAFFEGSAVSALLDSPFGLHVTADFSDWTGYPAVNDNLRRIALIVCIAAAAVSRAIGTLGSKERARMQEACTR